jgi:hypothetical protein
MIVLLLLVIRFSVAVVHSSDDRHSRRICVALQGVLLLLACILSGRWNYIPPLAALLPLSLLGIIEADMLYQIIKTAIRSRAAGTNASTIAAQQGKLALAAAACESALPILWLETGRLWGNACRSSNCFVSAAATALATAVAEVINSSSERSRMSGSGCFAGGGLGRTLFKKFEWFCGANPLAQRYEQQQATVRIVLYVTAVAAQAFAVYKQSIGSTSSGWGCQWLTLVVAAAVVVHAGTVTFLAWLWITRQRC